MLCLLEVARIACTRHQFSPAPGLVEFEQEIDREIEKEMNIMKMKEEEVVGKNHLADEKEENRMMKKVKMKNLSSGGLLLSGIGHVSQTAVA